MTDIVKVYLDQTGFLAKTVFVTNDPNYNHTLHDEPRLIGVVLSAKEYQNTDPPSTINGVAYSTSLYAAIALKAPQALQAKILSNNIDPDSATLTKSAAI